MELRKALAMYLVAGLAWPGQAPANTFTVTNTSDAGGTTCATNCSLRQAINAANQAIGTDTVAFAIPGPGPHRISPTQPLPTLRTTLVIDGYSQPGSLANTQVQGSDAVIGVQIDGALAPETSPGLALCTTDASVRGLSLTGFRRAAITVGFDNELVGCSATGSNTISGNFIGVEPNGTVGGLNQIGVQAGVAGVVVGGPAVADRNLVSRNAFGYFGRGGLITGNLIGTDRSGLRALGNLAAAIQIETGPALIENNTIAHNAAGVLVTGTATGVEIGANDIGPSTSIGLDLTLGNTPDGRTPNDFNDADEGPNRLQNYPQEIAVSRAANGIRVSGRIDRSAAQNAQSFTVRVYASPDCTSAPGLEGRRYLGEFGFTSAGPMQETFVGQGIDSNAALPFGSGITLTATDVDGNTSEFSDCAVLGANSPTFTVTKVADTADGQCNADCSLREAMLAANAQTAGARIAFAIPGAGPHTLAPGTPLPTISAPLSIDGYTQPGSAVSSLTGSMNAVIKIVLDGRGIPGQADGLRICARDSVVRGLSVIGFARGIVVGGRGAAACPSTLSGVAIIGNYIGLAADGLSAVAHLDHGVTIDRCENCRIGGAVADANTFGGSGATPQAHILLGSSPLFGSRIDGNQIGTAANGSLPRGAQIGIYSDLASNGLAIGSLAPNRVRFNGHGIVLGHAASSIEAFANEVTGNTSGVGIDLVRLDVFPDGFTANDLDDADAGGNRGQNHPAPVLAGKLGELLRIQGALDVPADAHAAYRIAVALADPASCASGRGQAVFVHNVSTVRLSGTSEAFEFSFPASLIAVGDQLVLTATDRFGNTSEFTPCVAVTDGDRLFVGGFEQ